MGEVVQTAGVLSGGVGNVGEGDGVSDHVKVEVVESYAVVEELR